MLLQHWPNELLLSVMQRLPQADLFSASLVSRHWSDLSRPLLYSDVEILWKQRGHTRTASIHLFLRSLVERPELSEYVRGLHLKGVGLRAQQCTLPFLSEDEAAAVPVEALVDAVRETGVHEELRLGWEEGLREGTMDAFVALLLARLPNLASLYMDANYTLYTGITGCMLDLALSHPATCNLPRFRNLRRVVAVDWGDRPRPTGTPNTDEVMPLFYLPSIQHLQVTVDNPKPYLCVAPPSSPITALESLHLNRLREANLEPLLSVLPGLKKLKYDWLFRYDIDPHVSTELINLDQMASALDHARDSLTDLTVHAQALSVLSADHPDDLPLSIVGSLDGLSNLRKLERLTLPWVFLAGAFSSKGARRLGAAIPSSTRSLTLTADLFGDEPCDWSSDAILSLVRDELTSRRACCHNLRRISLELFPLSRSETSAEKREELMGLAERVGIELVLPV